MDITNLDIISEYIIISHFQAWNTRQLTFTLLYLEQIILPRIRNPAQFIQVHIHTVLNHPTFIDSQWRIILYLFGNPVTNSDTKIQLFPYLIQTCIIRLNTCQFNGFDGLQCHFQLNNFARSHTPYSHFGNNTFQIPYQM